MAELSDETVDQAIHEYLIRAGQRAPEWGNEHRWKAEGKRRIADLDTLRDWMKGKP